MINIDIAFWNAKLKNKSPQEIIDWGLGLSQNKMVSTSFGVYSAVLLEAISKFDKNISVIWCDTLYNQPSTYEHANKLTIDLDLNVKRYQSLISKEVIEATIGIPGMENYNHEAFSEAVKLEPFRRALDEHKPEVWFTNIRAKQTEFRAKQNILSYSKEGILKISPFYYWSDKDLDVYMDSKNLSKNTEYFDPVKALANRECGIHFQ